MLTWQEKASPWEVWFRNTEKIYELSITSGLSWKLTCMEPLIIQRWYTLTVYVCASLSCNTSHKISFPAHLGLGLCMFSARSPEFLLALVLLPHPPQYKPLLPIRVCLLPVPTDANTWTAKSPTGPTNLLSTCVFCWLPPHVSPDCTSHSVCSNESALLSSARLLLQQTGTDSSCSWELRERTQRVAESHISLCSVNIWYALL